MVIMVDMIYTYIGLCSCNILCFEEKYNMCVYIYTYIKYNESIATIKGKENFNGNMTYKNEVPRKENNNFLSFVC